MSEINIQNGQPTLISLAYAAKLTGYHQDYLGQLCRAGKLPASKVGRNWFTSKEAIEKLSSPVFEEPQINEVDSMESEEAAAPDFVDESLYQNSLAESTPVLVQSFTISQVDGIPVALRTVENPVYRTSNLKELISNMRIQSLQAEVSELREMLSMLMAEVSSHAKILQSRGAAFQPNSHDLKNHFVSNMDFGLAAALQTNNIYEDSATVEKIAPVGPEEWEIVIRETNGFPYATWLAATAALVMIVYVAIGIFSGSFLGHPNQDVSTIYHHSTIAASPILPTVAGDSIQTPESLPTGTSGENAQNMVQ